MIVEEADYLRLDSRDFRPATLKPQEVQSEEGLHFYTLTLKYPGHMAAFAYYVRFRHRLEMYGMNFELMMVEGEGQHFVVISSTNAHIMAQAELMDWGDAEVVDDTPDNLTVIQGKMMSLTEPGLN